MKTSAGFTYQDYLLMGDDVRYELFEGDRFMVPAPDVNHQVVSKRLESFLIGFVEGQKGGEVLDAPVDVVLAEDVVVQPDLLCIFGDRLGIVKKSCIRGAPDIVVEILSPGSIERDRIIKNKLYHKYGVREYWIVDIDAREVEVLSWKEEGYCTFRVFPSGSTISTPLTPGLTIPVGELFKNLL